MVMSGPRIIFITSGHNPLSSRLFHKELKSLQKIYRDLSIIAPHEKSEESLDGIAIYGVQKYKSRYNRWATLLALYKKSRELEPDIIHCHEPDSLFVAYILKRKFPGTKVIYDCHEFHPQSFTENFPRPLRDLLRILIEKCENYLAEKSDAIITVNPRLVVRFKRWNARVVLLPNYPLLETFMKIERKREILSSSEVRLIYVGIISSDRGAFKMLELLRDLGLFINVKLMLIGKFASEAVHREFWKIAEEHNLTNRIDYKGYLPHEETIQNLMSADIGLFLVNGKERYNWGEPIKYFEYSAAGLPVIISDLPAKRALIEQNRNGILINPEKIEESVEAIKYLVENSEKVTMMSQNGRKVFLEKYNWERTEPRLLDLYGSLIDP
jgi:glycosyltransferase involved in cell wall biosynthesis